MRRLCSLGQIPATGELSLPVRPRSTALWLRKGRRHIPPAPVPGTCGQTAGVASHGLLHTPRCLGEPWQVSHRAGRGTRGRPACHRRSSGPQHRRLCGWFGSGSLAFPRQDLG